ncbi:MAG: transcriptional regulator [Bacteroidetes bacterium]|nr:transcriptional regulator [Bacteroidota bacterium]
MTLSAEEFKTLLSAPESDLLERKRDMSGSASRAIREAICSFSNDMAGHGTAGHILIGLDDSGKPSGLIVTDALLRQLADIRYDGQIVPPPAMFVEQYEEDGYAYALVTVLPADSPPVRYQGRICVRIGPRRGYADAQEERILNERRRFRDKPFDVQPALGSTLADLSTLRFLEEYLPKAVHPDVLAQNERTLEQKLASTKMVRLAEDPVPTVLGMLVLGRTPREHLPGDYIQFLRIDGEQLHDPVVDELFIEGSIVDLVRRAEEKVEANNRVQVRFADVVTEQRKSLYPLAAVQQFLRNAVLHRNYEGTNAPVRVYFFNNRLEITSPGGPYGQVNASNFGSPGITDYRNPNLAEAMRALGLIQRFGAGIALAQKYLRENGNPEATFEVTDQWVKVVLKISAVL